MPKGLTPAEYSRYLKKLAGGIGYQMRFVVNKLAFLAKDRETKYLKNKLTLRNQYMKKGVMVTKAKSKENPTAYVYHRYEGLAKQQEGGTYRPRKSSNIAIPREIRKSDRTVIGKSRRPAAMLSKENVFATKSGIFQQLKTKLKLLYLLVPKIKLKKKIDFAKPVKESVKNNAQRVIQEAIDFAVKKVKF